MKQCLAEGLPFPDKIANAPELISGLELYYLAFFELTGSRQMGMALGTIPWKVIHDYCVAHEFSEDQKEEFHHHITEMDSVYLEYHRRKK